MPPTQWSKYVGTPIRHTPSTPAHPHVDYPREISFSVSYTKGSFLPIRSQQSSPLGTSLSPLLLGDSLTKACRLLGSTEDTVRVRLSTLCRSLDTQQTIRPIRGCSSDTRLSLTTSLAKVAVINPSYLTFLQSAVNRPQY